MASLKYELDQWNEGVIAFDQGLYEDALAIFEPIADSAKIHFNIGVVYATLGEFEEASKAYTMATDLDQYLAIAYFQNGVANVALEDYDKALACFHDAYLYMRGNMVIDYTQLGLEFKLFSCQVLFNRALCYLELNQEDLGMTDLWRATREKQTKEHDILDQALREKGQDSTVFTVPQGVLYRPPESKVKNSKKKDYLGNSKVIAAIDSSDSFTGFQGKSAWQVQMSGPTNIAAVEEPRPMTPPNAGLQRRATERVGVGRARRGTDPERPQLGHSASFSGLDSTTRRGPPGPSSLGQNGPDSGRGSPLSRRNTDAKRPAPLNLDETNSNRAGPASAAPAVPPVPIGAGANGGKAQYMDELDDIDRHVYALSIEAQEFTVNDRTNAMNYNGTPSNADLRVSPVPSRSNSNGNGARLHHPKPLGLSAPVPVMNGHMPTPAKSSYGSSPPTRMGTPPVMDLRRNGSANQSSGLRRDDSVRSAASGGSGGSNGFYQQPTGNGSGYVNGGAADASYLDEPVYSTLRDKIRVKCHYIDTRAVLVRADMPLQELVQRVQEKFQCTRTLKLKYKDEDQHMLSMIDDEDWLMAQDVHIRTMGGLDRIELWCFDEDD